MIFLRLYFIKIYIISAVSGGSLAQFFSNKTHKFTPPIEGPFFVPAL